jgi:hypothetical protein
MQKPRGLGRSKREQENDDAAQPLPTVGADESLVSVAEGSNELEELQALFSSALELFGVFSPMDIHVMCMLYIYMWYIYIYIYILFICVYVLIVESKHTMNLSCCIWIISRLSFHFCGIVVVLRV